MLELLLVRHGVTAMNETRRWQGWEDEPLSDRGVMQAQAAARVVASDWTPVQALYCSPLRRAAQTAEMIGDALGMAPVPVDGLRECGFGEVSGLTTAQMEARYPGILKRWVETRDCGFCWPEGESHRGFMDRVQGALDGILRRERSGRVLIVAHGGSLCAILSSLFPDALPPWWDSLISNCSITVARLQADGPTLVTRNATAHLTDSSRPVALTPPYTETPSGP